MATGGLSSVPRAEADQRETFQGVHLNDRARFSCTLEQFSESVVRDENGNSPCECSRGDTPQGREFPCRRLSPNCVISSSNGSSKICMPVARPSCVSAT